MRTFVALAAAVAAASMFAGCDSGGSDTKCAVSADCNAGLVCQAQKCVERTCTGSADCNGTDICVDGALVGKGDGRFCTAKQCSDDGTLACADGKVCQGGICVIDTTPDVIEDNGPVTDLGPDTTGRDDTPVDQGGTDNGPLPGNRIDCKPCTGDTDCGTGAKCLPVGATKHCLMECADDGDCPASYICYAASTAAKSCLPVSYSCVACAYETPCTDGKSCDFVSGNCDAPAAECGNCTYDFDCAAGFRCLKKTGNPTGACVAECGANKACTDTTNFTCGASDKGVEICQPKDPDKCGGCPADKPFPSGDGVTCYECLNNSNCEVGKELCDAGTHTCIPDSTTGCGSGLFKCNDGQCKQCCQDSDCKSGEGPCTGGACVNAQDPCQGQCADPFPVCAIINNIAQCVQCKIDGDCAKIDPACTCTGDPTYSCLQGDGSVCAGSTCSALCTSDADCPPGTDGTTLLCSTPGGGFCYDPAGKCDNMSACCSAGQTCFDVLGILFGGLGGGGIPGMPGGGGLPSTGMAVCSCDDSHPCLGGKACTGTAAMCSLPFLSDMICPGGVPPSNMPEKLCFDIMDLLGGLLGGGGLP